MFSTFQDIEISRFKISHPDNFKVDNVSIGNLEILKNLESLQVLKPSNLEARKEQFFTTPKISRCSRFQDIKM